MGPILLFGPSALYPTPPSVMQFEEKEISVLSLAMFPPWHSWAAGSLGWVHGKLSAGWWDLSPGNSARS